MQILKKTNLKAWKKSLDLGQDKVLDLLEKKALVGRGGAAFPTAKKMEVY